MQEYTTFQKYDRNLSNQRYYKIQINVNVSYRLISHGCTGQNSTSHSTQTNQILLKHNVFRKFAPSAEVVMRSTSTRAQKNAADSISILF